MEYFRSLQVGVENEISYNVDGGIFMNQQHIGEYIGMLRKKKGLTQTKLGEVIGVSDKAISKWENGDGLPDVGVLTSLASALDTSVDSLLNGGPIPLKRLLKSAGSNRDIATIKLIGAYVVASIPLMISLSQLYNYLSIKQQLLNLVHWSEWPANALIENYSEYATLYDLTVSAGMILFLTGLSYVIYRYARTSINRDLSEPIELRFYITIMRCLWQLNILFVAAYELSIKLDILANKYLLWLVLGLYGLMVMFQLVLIFKPNVNLQKNERISTNE